MTPVRLAVVGAGVMGANHVRIARQLPDVELVAVVDPDLPRAEAVVSATSATATTSLDDVFEGLDLAVIAAPTELHLDLAMRCIERGVGVLIEKPLAASVTEAQQIVKAAGAANVLLAAGHVERFNAAVAELPHLLEDPLHIKATRVSPYSARISDGVVHDLMIHDLDIVLSLVGRDADVTQVGGTTRRIHSDTEDLANAHVQFSTGLTAAFETSRLGQQKVRQVEITQRESVIVADLLRQDVTVHRMSRHEYLADDGVRYRQSSVVEIPFLEQRGEPLQLELRDVVDSFREGRPPRVSGEDGLRALRLADMIATSLTPG